MAPQVQAAARAARYAVLEVFIAALREQGAKPERQLDILRRLRLFDHPDLFAVCRELARVDDAELARFVSRIWEGRLDRYSDERACLLASGEARAKIEMSYIGG